MQEEDEFRVADADGVAILDSLAAHRDSINESAVVAVEVNEFEVEAGLLNRAMSP
jgi:hypothetical protein